MGQLAFSVRWLLFAAIFAVREDSKDPSKCRQALVDELSFVLNLIYFTLFVLGVFLEKGWLCNHLRPVEIVFIIKEKSILDSPFTPRKIDDIQKTHRFFRSIVTTMNKPYLKNVMTSRRVIMMSIILHYSFIG